MRNFEDKSLSETLPEAWRDTLLPAALEFTKIRLQHRFAKRSGENYMLHITEGLQVLTAIGANEFTKAIFALHPFFQMQEEWAKHKCMLALNFPMLVHAAGFDYALTANACLPGTGRMPELSQWREVNQALVADKVQNYAAFKRKLDGVHTETQELHRYFRAWIDKLAPYGANLKLLDLLL